MEIARDCNLNFSSGIFVILGDYKGLYGFCKESVGDVAYVHSKEEESGSIREAYQPRTHGACACERRLSLEDPTAVSIRGTSRQIKHVHSPEEDSRFSQKIYQLRSRGASTSERRPFLEDPMVVSTQGTSH